MNGLLYQSLKGLIKMNNKSKDYKTEGKHSPINTPLPESSLVLNSSTGVELGVLVTTGAVDNKKQHRCAATRGSPSKFK